MGWRKFHSTVDWSAPSILPPQVQIPTLFQYIFELCHVENTKINKKRPGLAHF